LSDGGLAIQYFKVYKGLSADDLTFYQTVESGTTLADVDVMIGVTYHYTVSSVNTALEGPMSAVVAVTSLRPSSPPLDLLVTLGDGEVVLTWRPPSDTGGSPIDGYVVYRGTVLEELDILASLGDDTSYKDVDVENGRTYYYKVRALTASGPGTASMVVSGTPMGIPGVPEGFTISSGEGYIELLWLPPYYTGDSGLEGYRIYRGPTADDMAELVSVASSSIRYSDLSVMPGVGYHYTVTAFNALFEGVPTDALSAVPIGLPSEPQLLSGVASDGAITLSWASPHEMGGLPVRGYQIYVGTSPDDLFLIKSLGDVQTATLSDLENGVIYHIAISASNDLGEGPRCAPLQLVPMGLPGVPSDVRVSATQDSVTIDWTPPEDDGGSGIIGYILLRGTTSSDLSVLTELGDLTTFTDTGLQPGTNYFYRVIARTSIGDGEPSTEVSAMTEMVETPAPSTPGNQWVLVAGAALILMAVAGAAAYAEPSKYRITLLLAPLIAKKEEVLDNKTRHALLGIIMVRPGIHYSALREEFGLSNGAAAYHLDVLEKEEYIRSVRDGVLKRFYSTDTKVPRTTEMTPEEVRATILEFVRSRPGVSQKRIINELGIDRDSVGYYLREMVKEGTLRSSREGRYMVYKVK
jgi:DNA-binding MarR family transcriptional regulator/fibronectin type 3 domain-containing protein